MEKSERQLSLKWISVGIVIGIILSIMVGASMGLFSKENGQPVNGKTSDSDISSTDNSSSGETTTSNEVATTIEDDSSGIDDDLSSASGTWDKTATYTGGITVTFDGKIFKAKWWTQGETPSADNADGAWEYIGEAEPPEETTAEPEEPEDDTPGVVAPAKAGVNDFKVVGYYPSWQPDKVKDIKYEYVTHINYAFAIPKSDGTLLPLENPNSAKKIIKEGHKNGVKVLIAIGGWSYNEIPLEPTFKEATSSPEKITSFANEIIAMVKQYGFDGVDMDWEHPRRDDTTSKQYTDLMKTLSVELKKDNLLLTSAVLAGVSADGNVLYDAAAHTQGVIDSVDWFNIMAYDGGDGERHSSYDFAVKCGEYWKNTRKMPANKVVLGVPFYGRPSWRTYDEILAADSNAHTKDTALISGVEVYYNGIPTIQKKTKWAKDNLGGVMIWEISQDTKDKEKSLLKAINDVK